MPWFRGVIGPRQKRFRNQPLTPRENQKYNRAELWKRVPSVIQDVDNTSSAVVLDDELWDADILKSRANHGKGVDFSPQQKIRVATAYAITGNMLTAADIAGVPYKAASGWKHTKWWPILMERVRKIKSEEFDSKATGLIDQFLEGIKDRLENGEEVVLKDGSKTSKKVNMKDMAIALSILFEKRALGRGEATSRTEKVDTNKMLEQLKNQFKNVTKDIEGERVDAPFGVAKATEGERVE